MQPVSATEGWIKELKQCHQDCSSVLDPFSSVFSLFGGMISSQDARMVSSQIQVIWILEPSAFQREMLLYKGLQLISQKRVVTNQLSSHALNTFHTREGMGEMASSVLHGTERERLMASSVLHGIRERETNGRGSQKKGGRGWDKLNILC